MTGTPSASPGRRRPDRRATPRSLARRRTPGGGRGPGRERGQAGQVGGVEGLAFGVLVFVFGALLVTNAWGVIDAKMAATSAAREAARTYVESPTAAAAAAGAEAAGFDAIVAHGRLPERARVERVDGGPFSRCARVVIEVTYRVPLVVVPLLGQTGDGMTVTARHAEVVDPYRTGVPGSAACDA